MVARPLESYLSTPLISALRFQATMFTPGVYVADNNNGQGFPADGSVGHGVHTLCIPASSYGRITPFV